MFAIRLLTLLHCFRRVMWGRVRNGAGCVWYGGTLGNDCWLRAQSPGNSSSHQAWLKLGCPLWETQHGLSAACVDMFLAVFVRSCSGLKPIKCAQVPQYTHAYFPPLGGVCNQVCQMHPSLHHHEMCALRAAITLVEALLRTMDYLFGISSAGNSP